MNIWNRTKATIVGLHADWYTDFARWRKPAHPSIPQPIPTRPESKPSDGPGPGPKAEEESPRGISEKVRFVVSERLYSGPRDKALPRSRTYGIHFVPDDPYVERMLDKMKERGWTNLKPVFTGFDGFTVHGSIGDETGYFEPVFADAASDSLASRGELIGVRTCAAMRTFTVYEEEETDETVSASN